MMTNMETRRLDWPQYQDGTWGFLIAMPNGDTFFPRKIAVDLALTHFEDRYQHVFWWWDVFLEFLGTAQFLPAIDFRSEGLIPVWRILDIEEIVRGRFKELPLTPDEVAYLSLFFNDSADDFIRHHAPDLEAKRAIGGPLGRRLVARLMRPRSLWDVNSGDRRLLQAALREWEHNAEELAQRTRSDAPIVRITGFSGEALEIAVDHLTQRELGEWGLHFPLWHRLLSLGVDARVAVLDEEAESLWREELPRLVQMGVKIELPAEWKNPRVRVRGKLHSAAPTKDSSFFGLDQIVDVDWQVLIGDEPMDLEDLEALVRASTPLVRLHGQFVVIDDATLKEAKRAYDRARKTRVKMADALRWAVGGIDEGIEVVSSGQVYQMLSQLMGPYPEAQPMTIFQGDLRPYQQDGVQWLLRRMKGRVGALLADDMGLGKTVEVIAALSRLQEENQFGGPVLIVAPLSVVGNWEREFHRFNPTLTIGSHLGTAREGGDALYAWACRHNAVLTTYDVLLRDAEVLRRVPWIGVVADEAQQIKNPGTKRARAMRQIPSHWRIALTGTPVENRVHDLWAEMEFLNPGYLGSEREFRQRFERIGDPSLRDLRKLLGPFVLRRMKTDPTVMPDLPPKVELREWTHLTPEQIALYQAVVDTLFRDVSSTMTRMARRGAIVAALTHLKQIVNHPALYLHQTGPIKGRSAKLDRLMELLTDILDAGERVVVFTQYVSFVNLLAPYLRRHFHVPILTFHGSLTKAERDDVIAQFTDKNGPPILLASLKAGGVGLNLASAQHVIHYDRWWNPATEDQATDRVWRMGQTELVTVHKFVTRGTVEERIDTLIQTKRQLSDRLLSDSQTESWVSDLSNRELRELVELRESIWTD